MPQGDARYGGGRRKDGGVGVYGDGGREPEMLDGDVPREGVPLKEDAEKGVYGVEGPWPGELECSVLGKGTRPKDGDNGDGTYAGPEGR